MYPNPARNTITITTTNDILLENATIVNVNGKIVKSVSLKELTNNTIEINELSTGIYFVNIRSNSGKTTIKKLIKL
jgi:hypothetical protein